MITGSVDSGDLTTTGGAGGATFVVVGVGATGPGDATVGGGSFVPGFAGREGCNGGLDAFAGRGRGAAAGMTAVDGGGGTAVGGTLSETPVADESTRAGAGDAALDAAALARTSCTRAACLANCCLRSAMSLSSFSMALTKSFTSPGLAK